MASPGAGQTRAGPSDRTVRPPRTVRSARTVRPSRAAPARAASGLRRVALRLGVPVGAVLVWQWAAWAGGSVFFPTPARILAHAHTLWFSGPAGRLFLSDNAFAHLLPSLGRVLGGFCAAALCGVLLGLVVGRSRTVYALCDPVLQFARAVPPPALVPVFVVLFDPGTRMQLASIVFSAVWPVLVNTADGVRGVDPLRLEVAAVLRMPLAERVLLLHLPAALPRIFAGLRISLSLSLILMVFSELLPGTSNGIGYQLVDAQSRSDLLTVWAVIVLLGVAGQVLNSGLLACERLLLGGRREERARPDPHRTRPQRGGVG
ncbi:ABC transporter permease [Streptomyces sp. NPDC093085]|uniref:ABC transporter permease n=1 Tax=Streptomyces sp. NPDC093085 TaxID=3155068 RepID=UPI003438D28D